MLACYKYVATKLPFGYDDPSLDPSRMVEVGVCIGIIGYAYDAPPQRAYNPHPSRPTSNTISIVFS